MMPGYVTHAASRPPGQSASWVEAHPLKNASRANTYRDGV